MVLGAYSEILGAKSTDKNIRKISQDGGIITSLLCFALDEKIIDGAVVAGSRDNSWRPEPQVALTSDEIIAAGTKSTVCPNIWVLKAGVRQYGLERAGIVTKPCQTTDLRKMLPLGVRFLADKIALNIGVFCTENFPFESFESFITAKTGINFDIIEKIDIDKGKIWVYAHDDVISFPIEETRRYEQDGCNICLDLVSELSDLSTGSIGAPKDWSTVILRTDAGENVFKMAVDAGIIKTKSIKDIKPGIDPLEKLAREKKKKNQKNIVEMGTHFLYKTNIKKEDSFALYDPVNYEEIKDYSKFLEI